MGLCSTEKHVALICVFAISVSLEKHMKSIASTPNTHSWQVAPGTAQEIMAKRITTAVRRILAAAEQLKSNFKNEMCAFAWFRVHSYQTSSNCS